MVPPAVRAVPAGNRNQGGILDNKRRRSGGGTWGEKPPPLLLLIKCLIGLFVNVISIYTSLNEIFMFVILKTDYFQLWVLYKSDFRILLQKNHRDWKTAIFSTLSTRYTGFKNTIVNIESLETVKSLFLQRNCPLSFACR